MKAYRQVVLSHCNIIVHVCENNLTIFSIKCVVVTQYWVRVSTFIRYFIYCRKQLRNHKICYLSI